MKRFEIEKWLERRKAAVSTPLSVLNGGAPGAASAEDIAHGKAWRLNFELFPAFLRILAAFFVLRLPHHWLLPFLFLSFAFPAAWSLQPSWFSRH